MKKRKTKKIPSLYTETARRRISSFAKRRPRDRYGRFKPLYTKEERKALQAQWRLEAYHRSKRAR